ncbi:MAG: energy transducer TonB [Bacteroidales bacterium]|nr:energy transducer TonB [Bacteroidales bacterium]
MTEGVKHTIDEMVFENRNKEYGSYQLRRNYFRRLAIGFVVSLVFVLLITLGYFWYLSDAGDASVYLYQYNSPYLKDASANLLSPKELSSYISSISDPEAETAEAQISKEELKATGFIVTEDARTDTAVPIEEEAAAQTGETTTMINDSTVFGGFLLGDGDGTGANGNPFDRIPVFSGGNVTRYVEANLRYPAQAMRQKIHGVVIISFVVSKTGHVVDVKVERGVNPIIDEAAVRTIKSMPPWKPGMIHGRPINFMFRMPINFVPLS